MDQKETGKNDQVMAIFEEWLRREADGIKFMVKEHPRGQEAIEYFRGKVSECLREFILNGKVPEVQTVTTAEIENAMLGFWDFMGKKFTRTRS